jgi:hypothetical protein
MADRKAVPINLCLNAWSCKSAQRIDCRKEAATALTADAADGAG